ASETTAAGPINIGVLSVTSGAFAQLGQDAIDGINIAFEDVGYEVAGRPVNVFILPTDMTPETAIDSMRAAVNRDKCQIVLGPLSGSEGTAIKNSIGEFPNTLVNACCTAAETVTTRGIAPNLFRTSNNGIQPMHPFGEYIYEQGYKRIVTIGEDYDFPYSTVGALLKTFVEKGGTVAKKYWVPIGTSDYSPIITDLPKDIDGIFVTLSGTDIMNFLTQMESFGVEIPILGSPTSLDSGTVTTLGEVVDGVLSVNVITLESDRPEFKHLYDRYWELRGRPYGGFTSAYYTGALFTIAAIEAVNGNIEDFEAFCEVYGKTEIEAPNSHISLDDHHSVVCDFFVNEVQNVDGVWKNIPVKTYSQVGQFWNYDPAEYEAQPVYDKESIDQMFPDS
ncbi:MAG TPA: hypothetical protein DCS12_04275, partial [Clostridiales bacterium]|nr:hypothetical protein [Clostridiales bacterium]